MEILQGRDGRDGRDGGKGEKGEMGPQGERGETGPQGAKGDQGETGSKGSDGLPGILGPPGISGPKGAVGDKGSRGSPGLQGPQGERGLKGNQGVQGPSSGGAVYTRWGRTTCPSNQQTELVYSGRAGGTLYNSAGGAANLLCLPDDPEYSTYGSGTRNSALRGAEYQADSGQPFRSDDNHNMPCAVCYASTRDTVLMIPAKLTCPTNWTTEYNGYLMAGHVNHKRTLFECIDSTPQSVSGLDGGGSSSAEYHHVEVNCNDLRCPPYDAAKEVTCVVCTR